MATKLEKPLKREIEIGAQAFIVTRRSNRKHP
jgi:hypothetical protein